MLTANPLIALLDPDEHNPDAYNEIWHAFAHTEPFYGYRARLRRDRTFPSFAATILSVTGETVVRCNDCETVVLSDETIDYQGDPICESCQEEYYWCDDCSKIVYRDDTCYLEGYGTTVCDSCVEGYYWCENCEQYNRRECENCANRECDCASAHPRFRFPANGVGTIGNDERMTLTLPKGVISEAGTTAITSAVISALPTLQTQTDTLNAYHAKTYSDPDFETARNAWYVASYAHVQATNAVHKAVESVGYEWQGKRGNYPKRLSSALHKVGIKLAPETISEVGNLARQYSDDQSEFHIEFTRDLNRSAGYFYHEDSCWWQSYSNSRCALKNWGGLAMRTFANADDDHDDPSGRVFVFPLDSDFRPTQNAEAAHAYMVFNAYGALGGYTSARIIAHLAGKTYRKVTFGLDIESGYVNSSAGYLVCDPETIASAPYSFSFGGDTHSVAL